MFVPANKIQIIGEVATKGWNLQGNFNARTTDNEGFSKEKMHILKESIRTNGLDAPLIVVQNIDNYELIAGERRLTCILQLVEENLKCFDYITKSYISAQELYIDRGVECKVKDLKTPKEKIKASIQENVLHEPLTDWELIQEVRRLTDAGFTIEEQAEIMFKHDSWVKQSQQILGLHKSVVSHFKEGKLARSAALTFVDVDADKVDVVLDHLHKISYAKGKTKVAAVAKAKNEAVKELVSADAIANLSKFMGKPPEPEAQSKITRTKVGAAKKFIQAEEELDKLEEECKEFDVTAADCVEAIKKTGLNVQGKRRTDKMIRQVIKGEKPDNIGNDFYNGFICGLKWTLDNAEMLPWE